jgi:alkylation response protein AidB-like acyl-CoA dehydrogenase
MLDTNKKPTILFSDEQEQLLEVATNFCRDRFAMSETRKRIEAAEDFSPTLWNEIASLGWLGIAVPEEFGGSGLTLGEVVTVVEPMGEHLAGTPLVSTTLVAQALLGAGTQTQKETWLPKICEGAIGSLALSEPNGDWTLTRPDATATKSGDNFTLQGTKTFVTDAPSADLVIASVMLDGKAALILIDKATLAKAKLTRETVIDETRRSYRIELDGLILPASALLDQAKTETTLARIDQAACLLIAAEACGGANGAINVTVEYLKTRKQFERYIGSYQALKHPTVDALLAMEAARSHLYYAATMFGEGIEGEVAVHMAKAQSCAALAFAADRAIQFHGGFGFTYDCDAGLYRRRGIWCEAQFGDPAHHRAKLATLLL